MNDLERERMLDLTAAKLSEITGGELLPAHARDASAMRSIARVAIDSREVEPGDLFWALRGARHDGASFAAEAFARGAVGVVCGATGPAVSLPKGRWKLRVADTHAALWQAAARQRARFAGSVIAVTGSVGKTTARQLIHTVLGQRLSGTSSPRNYNNHIGLPLSMLALASGQQYAVFELGASGRGEIDRLANLCRPRIGVITTVADAHLGGFGSLDDIAEAKAELLANLPSDGTALLAGDCPRLRRIGAQSGRRCVWFGRGADCDVIATEVRVAGGQLSFCVGSQPMSVRLWGRHQLTPVLAAVAVGQTLGLSLAEIAASLARFEPLAMRCEVRRLGHLTVINDTYNASPAAMQAALELLRDVDADGRRIAVCGDMLELGEAAPALHRQLGEEVVSRCGADLLLACGRYAGDVAAGARAAGMPSRQIATADCVEATWPWLRRSLAPGDVVLVKGSRALALERLVQLLEEEYGISGGEQATGNYQAKGRARAPRRSAVGAQQTSSSPIISAEFAGTRHYPPSWVGALSSLDRAVSGSTAPVSAS